MSNRLPMFQCSISTGLFSLIVQISVPVSNIQIIFYTDVRIILVKIYLVTSFFGLKTVCVSFLVTRHIITDLTYLTRLNPNNIFIQLQTTPLIAPSYNKFLSVLSIPCLLYTSPSPRDRSVSRMPSSA